MRQHRDVTVNATQLTLQWGERLRSQQMTCQVAAGGGENQGAGQTDGGSLRWGNPRTGKVALSEGLRR